MSKKTGALFHYRIKCEEIYLVALCQQQICQYIYYITRYFRVIQRKGVWMTMMSVYLFSDRILYTSENIYTYIYSSAVDNMYHTISLA